jgi:hypothetical protein
MISKKKLNQIQRIEVFGFERFAELSWRKGSIIIKKAHNNDKTPRHYSWRYYTDYQKNVYIEFQEFDKLEEFIVEQELKNNGDF